MNLGPLFDPPDEDDEDTAPELDPPRSETVAEARAYIARHRDKGVICPCCDQRAQTYANSITTLQARWLIGLARASVHDHGHATGWVYLHDIKISGTNATKIGGKYGKLQHWHLIEKHPDRSATWRLTDRGHAWMRDPNATIPRVAFLYDNILQGYSTDEVTFAEALKKPYDHDETMSGAAERT